MSSELSPSQRYTLDSIVQKLDEMFPQSDLLHYYHAAAMELGVAVGADHSFIGAVCNEEPRRVETLVYCRGRNVQPNFSYELRDTPCEQVLSAAVCLYPDHVAELFPNDELLHQMMISGYVGQPLLDGERTSGIITALFMTPIRDPDFVEYAFRTLADCINKARTAYLRP